jgi:hypothetical protein
MDYPGRHTLEVTGPGKYDRAALLFGYAGKVEVFADRADLEVADFRDWFETDGEILRFTDTGPKALHYTQFYNRMGDKLYSAENRALVDVEDLNDDFSADSKGRPRVPYIYCSHTRVDLSDHCLTGDAGADSAERMKNLIDDIDTWYITRNFPRGQIGSSQANYVARFYNQTYGRIKHWNDSYALMSELLPRFYEPDVLTAFYADPVNGWGSKTWAVQNGFNKLMQTVLTPNVGGYSEEALFDGSALLTQSPTVEAQYELGVAQARFFSTSWQDGTRDCGYQWWECLHHIGFYIDKIMAIEALTDTETNFVARTTPEDLRDWRLGYYNIFPEQISLLGAAILSGGRLSQRPDQPLANPPQPSKNDWQLLAPYIQGSGSTTTVAFPNYASLDFTSPAAKGVNALAVDPYVTFSVQLYWHVLGMARLPSNFDQSYADEARVYLMGAAGSPISGGTYVATYRDPVTKLSYGAIRRQYQIGSQNRITCDTTLVGNFPGGQCPKTAAEAVIDRANELLAWSIYCDPNNATSISDDNCVINPFVSHTAKQEAMQQSATAMLLEHTEYIKTLVHVGSALDFGAPY